MRQCAWCFRVVDAVTGRYGIVAMRKLKDATHGICPRCKETLRAEIEATPVGALLAAA